MATTMDGAGDEEVVDFRAMPKIELHAHLTGSITRRCLHDIWRDKKVAGQAEGLEDPLVVMPEGQNDHDLTSFFPLFSSYIYRLINDLDSLRNSTKQVVHDFAADGVVYLELRTTPRAVPAAGLDKEGYVRTVLEAIEEAEREIEASRTGLDSSGGKGIRVRLILSVDRRNSVDEAWEVLKLAQKFMAPGLLASQDSHKTAKTETTPASSSSAAATKRSGDGGVVGIDLCGDVAQGRVDTFTPVMRAAPDSGLQLTVHFAESARTGTDEELETILSWRPKRLGHVIHVSERVKEMIISQSRGRRGDMGERRGGEQGGKGGKGEGDDHDDDDDDNNNNRPIGLELCLSSNVQLKMIVGSFDVHHFGEWWKVQDGPVIMPCTDDVGVFESTLSNEWRLVQQYFGLARQDITLLGRRSIDVIFGGEQDKARLREILW